MKKNPSLLLIFFLCLFTISSYGQKKDTVEIDAGVNSVPPPGGGGGCTAPANPSNPTASTNACGSKILTRSGSPPAGTVWYWQTVSYGTSMSNSSSTYTATQSGTYYIRSYKPSCDLWGSGGGYITVTINNPGAPATPSFQDFCSSGTLTRGTPPSGITWYWQGLSSSGTSTANSDPTYPVYSSGTYYIRSYQSGCWGPSTSVAVTLTQAPSTPPTPLQSGNACGDVTLSWNGTPSQFIRWCWQTSSTGTNMSAMTSSYVVSSSGTYYLRAYDMNTGCWGLPSQISVTVNQPPPPPSSNPTSDGNCGAAVLTRAEPPSGITWYWVGTDPNGTGTAYSGTTYTATSSGTYYLRARQNSTGCWSTSSASVTVTVYQLPSTPAAPTINNTCGTGVIERSTATSGETWYWQGTNAAGTSTGDANQTYTVPSSGTYYLRARNNTTGCWSASSSSVTITVNALPSAPPNPTIVTTCGTGSLQRSAPPAGYTFYWQGTNSSGTSTTDANVTYAVASSGTYYLRTRDNSTLCWSASSGGVSITVNPSVGTPTPVNGSREEPGIVNLSATPGANGNNAKWYDAQTNGSLLLPSPSLTYSPGPSVTSTYYVSSVNTTTGCESSRVPITATIYPKPVISAPSTQLSMGSKIILVVSNNTYTTYQWKRGTTVVGSSSTYEADRAGSYTVTVTKTGMTGTGTSAPVELKRSVDDQLPMNYFIVNNVTKEGVTSPDDIELLTAGERTRAVDYIGGLGNSLQRVVSQGSPLKHDIIQTARYDALGRQLEQYLPYVSDYGDSKFRPKALDDNGYTNGEQYAFYQRTDLKIDTDTKPYSTTQVEPSPLQRVLSQTGPGEAWHDENKKVLSEFKLNRLSDNIRRWKVVSGVPVSTSAYGDYNLQVSVVTDENSHQRKVYVDKLGRTVLQAVQSTSTEWLKTVFVYDDFGRLAYTISPEGVKTGNLSPNQTFLDQHAFQYRYDALGRLIEYKASSGGWLYTVYDKLDRPVLTQNADQRSRSEWAFVKYDIYGRPVVTGYVAIPSSTRASVQTSVDAQSYQFELTSSDAVGYTLNRTYPTTATESDLLSISYFDNYGFLSYSGWDAEGLTYTFVPEEGSTNYNTNLVGLPTGGKIRVLGATSTWLNAVQYYDRWYRPLQIIAENHLGGLDRSTNKYNTLRQLAENRLSHNNAEVVVVRKIGYDHSGRVTQIFQNINSAPSDQLVAQYEYNELGQLVDKKLHNVSGGSFLQSVDYRYNIRGWIASINNAQLNINAENNDDANDFFGIQYLYETAEPGMNDQTNDEQYFNGNISAIKWKGIGARADDNDQQSYKFKYDQSDRLLTATSQMKSATGWASEAGVFNENMTYDYNGNIQTLQRNHGKYQMTGSPSYVAESVDNLTYTYNSAQKNQLLKVEDTVAPTTGTRDFKNGKNEPTEYTYNGDGNLTADLNKGITSVEYNTLGKVSAVHFSSDSSITYLYDAAGNKLKMTVQQGTNQTITDYVGGFVYENSTLKFFGSPEGRVVKNGSNFEYQYAIADHQGNTRVVFTSATLPVDIASTDFETNSGQLENFPSGANLSTLPLFNHTTPSGTKSQLLNGGYQGQVGVGKSFAVVPGDKVKVEAYAKYEGTNSNSQAAFASVLLAAFNLPAPAPGEIGTASAGLNSWGSLVDGGYQSSDPGAPEAHVNIVIFDKNYNFIDVAYTQISDEAEQVDVYPDVDHEYLMKEYTVKEAGFVYVYVSNNSPVNVYFDDVTISHTPTNVIQYNEYYPFGLQTENSWTRADNRNNFLYNGGSELNQNTAWYETFFRGYDAALGRFSQVDPLASASMQVSPYAFAFNDPIFHNDPSGAYPPNTYEPMSYEYDDSGGGGGLMPSFGPLQFGQHFYGAGSAHDWFRQYASVERNARVMSQSQFDSYYGIHSAADTWNLGNSIGASVGSGNFASVASAYNSGAKFTIDGNSLDILYLQIGAGVQINGSGDPIPGTEAGANIFYYDNIDLNVGMGVFGDHYPANSSILKDFWSGFSNSDKGTNYGTAASVVGTSGFWLDGVGAAVRYGSGRSFGELRNVVKAGKLFRGIGVVGGIATTALTAYESSRDGIISGGDAFKIGMGIAQIGLAFTPVGWAVLTYNGLDLMIGITTGTSLTDRIANGIDNITN